MLSEGLRLTLFESLLSASLLLEDDGGDSFGLALGVVRELDDLDGADGGDHQFLQGKGSVSYDGRAATESTYLNSP